MSHDIYFDSTSDNPESGKRDHRSCLSFFVLLNKMISDIAGANAARWSSVLVHTGVYDCSAGPPTHEPTHQADDVEAAVKWAVEREMGK